MLTAVYKFVNTSNPNITDDCWFCLNLAPPYYVGLGAVAVLGSNVSTIRNLSAPNDTVCPWRKHPKLTLGDLQGQGTCIYTSSYRINDSTYRENCNTAIQVKSTSNNYLAAPKGTWFACNTGLTPCINLNYWGENAGFCILLHVIPQVYFYSGEEGREHFQYLEARVKRAPILVPLLVGIGVARSAAVGTAALVTGSSNYKALSQQINEDLSTLENSINHLETSLNSLAEVVLQNRRGLDLLFLKQGSLCIALGETCCFYANHSGIIRDSLVLIRQRVKDREERLRHGESWYEGLFNNTPWLTTLLTAITGPLILVFLGLLFGPCVINWITAYVKKRVQAVKLLVLRTHDQPLQVEDSMV
ncbi:endogenous retrovirus group S71 member 1 Env polyprotein-like [Pteropus vampyrus]|uniref:Endogenous retrovirus group S71 member 1 Env polyprotein-like n=1 Tax=Pteropus vampyrus TaxID=132908 RepID=A0A6P6BZ43_PTEVA|nr:endogenous retrovirus group S71 member 1 Env polyprotein-like [Pteropus vampyrus]XP_023380179.1 endogenous retrovirus group S71 member 1 Env polyprotein-like [Pteropus vampyrus]XP_023380180.1 endogenous retrovirus group S71 member 1 Env polyprotein-like [Pteropus vampyrus]XP_023380181.1 endogenous retrovirus group S71 member 1 Env polyprotein-like [Pteropus vampyrus]XP_023380182.1 endogenous retrovirus group S71 member 1 Env polyprotein-like [Pteropus vampyrus]XP_023380183.1 endogenous retr